MSRTVKILMAHGLTTHYRVHKEPAVILPTSCRLTFRVFRRTTSLKPPGYCLPPETPFQRRYVRPARDAGLVQRRSSRCASRLDRLPRLHNSLASPVKQYIGILQNAKRPDQHIASQTVETGDSFYPLPFVEINPSPSPSSP